MKSGVFFAIIVSIFFCTSSLAYDWSTNPGNGSPENPYQISEPNHLMSIGSDANLLNKNFVLTNDIVFDPNNNPSHVFDRALIAPDINSTTWDFIGTPFTGTFNGSNHTIHNFTIDTTGTTNNYYIGLFGQLRSSAVISNLGLENGNIVGGTDRMDTIGGLCASNGYWDYAGGTISNCYFSGNVSCTNADTVGGLVGLNHYGTIQKSYATGIVSSEDYLGGLVGWNYYGTINNCYSNSYVEAGDNSYAVGGLVGYNEIGNISNCHSNSYLSGGVNSYAFGGLVGEHYGEDSEGTISNCYATGTVNAEDTLGNLVGRNYYGTISNCYSAGIVTGKTKNVGGLVGYNYGGDIINCHSSDVVTGLDSSREIGGLVGWNYGTVTNCYATGSVTGGISSIYLGGLAGRNGRTITNCYASGTVSAGTGSSDLGGLCGINSSNINNCFWNTDLSSIAISDGGTPLDDPNMMVQANFIDWDFVGEDINGENEIWRMCVDDVEYPRLSWEFAQNGDFVCSGGVGILDLQALAENWLTAMDSMPDTFNYACDANGDEQIDLKDYTVMSENWGS